MSQGSEAKSLADITEAVLAQAMEYCAQKVHLDNTQAVIDCLREGDGQVCGYCYYSIAQQVAKALGALDENIKAAYLYDYDATPEDYCFGEAGRALPIHVLLWAERKTAALKALVDTWDRALAQCYAEVIGGHQPAHLLDVQVVDSADVEKRIGYGALLSSLHHRPIQVWER
jgi:hypothetical protein